MELLRAEVGVAALALTLELELMGLGRSEDEDEVGRSFLEGLVLLGFLGCLGSVHEDEEEAEVVEEDEGGVGGDLFIFFFGLMTSQKHNVGLTQYVCVLKERGKGEVGLV